MVVPPAEEVVAGGLIPLLDGGHEAKGVEGTLPLLVPLDQTFALPFVVVGE